MEKKKRKEPFGRPTKYKPEYCEQIIEFFDIEQTMKKKKQVATNKGVVEIEEEEAAEFPTFVDFAMEIGVNIDTLKEWRDKHPNFSAAYKKAKKLQEGLIISNGMKGRYNTTFALFFLKCNAGWNDKAAETEANRTFNLNYVPKKDDE